MNEICERDVSDERSNEYVLCVAVVSAADAAVVVAVAVAVAAVVVYIDAR